MSWRVDMYDSGEAHVRPVNDLVKHEMTAECVCSPEPRHDSTPYGDGWTYMHHSLDGREVKAA